MNCPNCSNEMKLGCIQSKSLMLWSEKKHKMFVSADDENEILLGEGNLFMIYREAYRCLQCGTIVIPPSSE